MTETTAPLEPKPLGDRYFQDPLSVFARMRAESPVTSVITPEGQRAWLITRYEDVRRALADPRLSKDWRKLRAPGFVPDPSVGFLMAHMLNADPPDHTRLRRLAQPAFSPRAMADYAPRVEATVAGLLGAAAQAGEFDLVAGLAAALPIAVICDLLGVPDADQDEFTRMGAVFGSALGGIRSLRHAAQVQRSRAVLARLFDDLFELRRREPGDGNAIG